MNRAKGRNGKKGLLNPHPVLENLVGFPFSGRCSAKVAKIPKIKSKGRIDKGGKQLR